jgi:hypothetical protein
MKKQRKNMGVTLSILGLLAVASLYLIEGYGVLKYLPWLCGMLLYQAVSFNYDRATCPGFNCNTNSKRFISLKMGHGSSAL